jgi:6,7-dimethyl-8-ribityllumazine synthase
MSDRTFDDDDRDPPLGDREPPPEDRDRIPLSDDVPSDESSVERASENVFERWPTPVLDDPPVGEPDELEQSVTSPSADWASARSTPDSTIIESGAEKVDPPAEPDDEPEATGGWEDEPAVLELAGEEPADASEEAVIGSSEHAPGELMIPTGVPVLEGEPRGERRAVGIVVSRFNGDVTSKLLEGALAELERCGVDRASITVMPVPGAFELPIAAMALAKTRRFACILALGCVIRGDTPHFDYVSSEAASGLQLAAIETGVPVAFGVLTLDRSDQAEARYDKGAEAVRTGLEMADVFANLRAAAAR